MGWVASNYQLPAYKKAGFNVVAICDKNEDILEIAEKKFAIKKAFTDYHKLLELKEVEIVDICTRATPSRVKIVKDVAKAGKHLLVQKPFARAYKDGLAMVQTAEKGGVKLGVNSHYRWIPAFRGAWSLLRQGYVGEPYLIVDELWGDMDDHYYSVWPERRWNAKIDDFIQVEWGAHHFDFIRFWAGREPISVYCSGTRNPKQNFEGEMICSYILEFPGALRAVIVINQVNKFKEGFFNFRIEGSEGVIRGRSPNYLELYSNQCGDKWWKWELQTDLSFGLPESYKGTMGDLMNAITESREHISSGRDNLKTIKAYLAGILSEKEKCPVNPAEIK